MMKKLSLTHREASRILKFFGVYPLVSLVPQGGGGGVKEGISRELSARKTLQEKKGFFHFDHHDILGSGSIMYALERSK